MNEGGGLVSERDGSWDELVDKLRGSVNDLRSAMGKPVENNPDEEAAAQRLRADLSRLEETAARLRASFTSAIDAQKAGVAGEERVKAEETAGQLKESLQELLGLARNVAADVKAGAQATYAQSEPELKSAIKSLEDVAVSTGAWIKAVLDPQQHSRD
jgi:phytoene dehydrogenase-like protein